MYNLHTSTITCNKLTFVRKIFFKTTKTHSFQNISYMIFEADIIHSFNMLR